MFLQHCHLLFLTKRLLWISLRSEYSNPGNDPNQRSWWHRRTMARAQDLYPPHRPLYHSGFHVSGTEYGSGQTETVSVWFRPKFRPKLCFGFGLLAMSIFGDSAKTLFRPRIHVLAHIVMKHFLKFLAKKAAFG